MTYQVLSLSVTVTAAKSQMRLYNKISSNDFIHHRCKQHTLVVQVIGSFYMHYNKEHTALYMWMMSFDIQVNAFSVTVY